MASIDEAYLDFTEEASEPKPLRDLGPKSFTFACRLPSCWLGLARIWQPLQPQQPEPCEASRV